MAVTSKVLFPAAYIGTGIATLYTAENPKTAVIDKFTATNNGTVAATISVYLSSGAVGNSSRITAVRKLAPNETYTFPEVTGHVLSSLDVEEYISAVASVGNSITVRISGREIT